MFLRWPVWARSCLTNGCALSTWMARSLSGGCGLLLHASLRAPPAGRYRAKPRNPTRAGLCYPRNRYEMPISPLSGSEQARLRACGEPRRFRVISAPAGDVSDAARAPARVTRLQGFACEVVTTSALRLPVVVSQQMDWRQERQRRCLRSASRNRYSARSAKVIAAQSSGPRPDGAVDAGTQASIRRGSDESAGALAWGGASELTPPLSPGLTSQLHRPAEDCAARPLVN